MDKIELRSLTLPKLEAELANMGEKSFRAKQIFSWLHQKQVTSFDEMKNVPKDLKEKLSEYCYISVAYIEKKQISRYDGTVKYLFKFNDEQCVESVVMSYHHGHTICISTQVGCKMGCKFCATGKQGFTRNLTAGEMIAQIESAQKDLNIRISNIVLMGMGEPLDNYDNVINFINIINNFFQKQYDGIQEDLFQIVTFANNNGDNFTKNILKTLLGKVLKDNDNVKQAIEIYNDQIAYFAKEKMAVGALLTWFLIADATLITDGAQSAMEIAEQALEVAQNPKIDSYFFTVLLKMVIAKCAITTSDFETAKIHLENAISLAKKFNMNDLLSRLYILYGKYFQELGLVKSAEQIEYLQNAEKMYKNAEELIAKTKNKYILKELRQSGKSLTTFCVMNNIKI